MSSCELTQSYVVPLKGCRNSVIEHNLVTIGLSVHWGEKGGDDPNLVIDITNKRPSTPYLQQNPSSVFVNSVHHQHQHQESVSPMYQQQYHHSSALNNHDLTNSTTTTRNTIGDHNDFLSTTTTTVVYNPMQPQLQPSTSSTAIQQIKADLKSQFSPVLRREPPLNQPYLSSQHVIQTPPANMNDSRLNTKMSTISPTSSLKTMPSVITPYFDFPQPSTMPCPSSTLKTAAFKSLICTCPNPTSYHVHDCAIFASSNNHESNTNFSPEPIRRPSINQTNIPRPVSTPQIPTTSGISIPPMKEPMITTTFVPFPNHNLMKAFDSSSTVTTIISQPPSFFNNTQTSPPRKRPSINTDNSFPQPSLNFSQVIINNQSNFQTNPSISAPIVGQRNTNSNNSRQRKKLAMKRNSLTNQDQTLFQNSNNSQEKNAIKPPSLLISPIQTQQGMFMLQDNSQITDNTLCGSMSDIKLNTSQQSSPHTNSNVRSPVEIDIPGSQNLNQRKVSSEDMDQTISEVIKGGGTISTHNSSTSTSPQQKPQKPSLSSQLVKESNEPITTTRTYLSSLPQKQQPSTYDSNISTLSRQNIHPITQQVICPNFTEQSQMNTLPTPNNSKKRNRSKPTNNSQSKRVYKPTINMRQQSTITSSVKSTSNSMNKPISWPDTPRSTSSSGSTTIAPIGNSNQHLTTDSLQMPDIDHESTMINYPVFNNEQIHIIYPNPHHGIELDDLFPSKIDEFDSSTPPPLPFPMSASTVSQILNSASAEKSSNTLIPSGINSDDVYEEFLPSLLLSSSSIWEGNQVGLSLLTGPDPQNNHVLQQQYYSQTDPSFDTNLQLQVRLLSDVQS